jgi:hypothetical protein
MTAKSLPCLLALDPDKYFIVVPTLFGNGVSSSPSNMPGPYGGPRFPGVTMYDNVLAQHRLLTEKFGVERIKLVTGFSMGAIQTYHWGRCFRMLSNAISRYPTSSRTLVGAVRMMGDPMSMSRPSPRRVHGSMQTPEKASSPVCLQLTEAAVAPSPWADPFRHWPTSALD